MVYELYPTIVKQRSDENNEHQLGDVGKVPFWWKKKQNKT